MKYIIQIISALIPVIATGTAERPPKVIFLEPLNGGGVHEVAMQPMSESLGGLIQRMGGIRASEAAFLSHREGKIVQEVVIVFVHGGKSMKFLFGRDDSAMWAIAVDAWDLIEVRRDPFRWVSKYDKHLIPMNPKAVLHPDAVKPGTTR